MIVKTKLVKMSLSMVMVDEEEEGKSVERVKWHDGEMETRNQGRVGRIKKNEEGNVSRESQSAVTLNRQLWDYQHP